MTTLEIERDVSLAPLTSLELGGPAKYFVRATDEAILVEALRWAAKRRTAIGGRGWRLEPHRAR